MNSNRCLEEYKNLLTQEIQQELMLPKIAAPICVYHYIFNRSSEMIKKDSCWNNSYTHTHMHALVIYDKYMY